MDTLRLLLAITLMVMYSQRADAQLSLSFDYSGAEAILEALEKDSLSDGAVDSLMNVPAVHKMIQITTGFSPTSTSEQFRDHIKYFVKHKQGKRGADLDWRLSDVWHGRTKIRALIDQIKVDENNVLLQTVNQLGLYQLQHESVEVTVYFFSGGNSGGGPIGTTGLYVNLEQADGDYSGMIWNLVHEIYHVMQNVAWRNNPEISAYVNDRDQLTVEERLLVWTLAEGTANFVVDPRRSFQEGPSIRLARERYERNTTPEAIHDNFELFEILLKELSAGYISWNEAYNRGFTTNIPPYTRGDRDAHLYFVGYHMAKAIDSHCGSECIKELFGQPAITFFQHYISLYQNNPEISGRFTPATEKYLLGLGPLDPPERRVNTNEIILVILLLILGIASAMLIAKKKRPNQF